MTPAWRDPRLALLKSALQKYIRRGSIDKATTIAGRLLELPGGRSGLARRLPVIAAEDVGVTWIPAAATDHGEQWSDARLIAVAAGLSAVPKSKDAYFLAATVWEGRLPVAEANGERFRDALTAGDHRLATGLALRAREERAWRSGARLMRTLVDYLADGPSQARFVATAALQREAKSGSGTEELIAAAIIAAIDQLNGPMPVLPTPAVAIALPPQLDWYVADGHTDIGQRVLRRVALRHRLPARLVADLMFCFESVRLGPSEIPSRWQLEAQELDARAYGWHTHADGKELWSTLREEVAAELTGALAEVSA